MKITPKSTIIICFIILISVVLFNIIINLNDSYILDTELTNMYINLINSLIIIFLTVQVYLYNKRKDELDFKTKIPLISIIQEEFSGSYFIKNIGGGPALNIRVLNHLNNENKIWNKNIIAFDLFGDNKFELDYTDRSQYLILYEDIYKNKFYSYMKDNRLEFGKIEETTQHQNEIIELLNYKRGKPEFSTKHFTTTTV